MSFGVQHEASITGATISKIAYVKKGWTMLSSPFI